MDPRSQEFIEDIGLRLIEKKLLDEHSLARAKRAQQKTNERFDHVLIHLGLVQERSLFEILAEYMSLRLIQSSDLLSKPLVAHNLEHTFLKRNKIIPVAQENGHLTVAMADPFNTDAIKAISYFLECEVQPCLILNTDFEKAIDTFYSDENVIVGGDNDKIENEEASEADIERLKDIASEAPIIQLVNQLINDAVEQGASDIHIEPLENYVHVRFRIDGKLRVIKKLPLSVRSAVTSRIKILGKLNIAERRLPQDGRIKIPVRGNDIDFRLSTTPTLYGESVVLRILDRATLDLNFSSLGFYDQDYEKFEKLLNQPNGIILVTGPTGSGKTTTLYTALSLLNKSDRKIFTVEDPIEYHLAGINQMQVHSKVGLNFATALRSILRQDPDIIMIGEIRDLETAQIAIQASLTGHLVLSTLHTNSATATLTRLLDMGIEDYLLTSTVTGILAQRLVRKLCPHCSQPAENPDMILKVAYESLEVSSNTTNVNLRVPKGCEKCHYTGFHGRTTVMELLVIDEEMRYYLSFSKTEAELKKRALQTGMKTMYQDGLSKVLNGETTLEEILDVTQHR